MIEQRRVPMTEADAAAMAERTTSQKFLQLLAARDFQGLAATLASDAHARLLLPYGLEEDAGRDAIVHRIESWFASASVFDLTSSSDEAVGLRQRLSWRFSVVRDGGSREVIEQLVYLDLGPHGIEQIDLLCSGFQAEPGVAAGPMPVFDAGDMGCADGLAQEFRRQLAKVPIGGSLEVVVSDPAAKGDLPSLARLLGQRVTSTEAHDDGRLTITVERQK
ncbi:MAG TPA: sulfurtransferase TusA family protein [Candidatus Dormibacteraeota bacterium]|nr:sulfurtransferase TusA family protein [Candidatus Dormibacteraeota bacterium]